MGVLYLSFVYYVLYSLNTEMKGYAGVLIVVPYQISTFQHSMSVSLITQNAIIEIDFLVCWSYICCRLVLYNLHIWFDFNYISIILELFKEKGYSISINSQYFNYILTDVNGMFVMYAQVEDESFYKRRHTYMYLLD